MLSARIFKHWVKILFCQLAVDFSNHFNNLFPLIQLLLVLHSALLRRNCWIPLQNIITLFTPWRTVRSSLRFHQDSTFWQSCPLLIMVICCGTSSSHLKEMHQVDSKFKNKHNIAYLQTHYSHVKAKCITKCTNKNQK